MAARLRRRSRSRAALRPRLCIAESPPHLVHALIAPSDLAAAQLEVAVRAQCSDPVMPCSSPAQPAKTMNRRSRLLAPAQLPLQARITCDAHPLSSAPGTRPCYHARSARRPASAPNRGSTPDLADHVARAPPTPHVADGAAAAAALGVDLLGVFSSPRRSASVSPNFATARRRSPPPASARTGTTLMYAKAMREMLSARPTYRAATSVI